MSDVFRDAISNFLAPIKDLLEDEQISEIMVNGHQEIFVEQKGKVVKTDHQFDSAEELMTAARAIAQSVGRVIDQEHPRLDARTPDGYRIHVVLPPISRNGLSMAIRKFSKKSLTLKDLIHVGALSKDAARFLDICIHLGKNIVVSGGTGSGKTTLLNVLAGRIPATQRLLVIEDASELNIESPHVLYFETRKEDEHNKLGEVTIRDLVVSAMRLRPDRIVVGEVRGAEAMDLLQVMNTGHGGSMGTVHANTPAEACIRVETLALMDESKIPPDVVRKMVGNAIDIIVQTSRFLDGSRKISHISEVLGVDEHRDYTTRDIYLFRQQGKEEDGRIIGDMQPCGYLPSFFDDIMLNKLPFPKSKFMA